MNLREKIYNRTLVEIDQGYLPKVWEGMEAWILKHITWSFHTFGPEQRTEGVLNHIRKEIEEIRDCPADPLEWIDIIILAIDGAWRSGLTARAIITALNLKQEENMSRKWSDWRTLSEDEPIEHIRE